MILNYAMLPIEDLFRFENKVISVDEFKELIKNDDIVDFVKMGNNRYMLFLTDDSELEIYTR